MREAYLLLEEGASVPQIDQALTDFGMPVGPFGMQDIAGIDVGARIRQYLKSIGKTRAEGPQSEIPDRLYRDGPLRPEDRRRLVSLRGRQPHADSRSAVEQLADEAAAKRGITARADFERRDHRADHDGAGQRRRARARGGLRDPRRRHRRDLLLRLRIPAASRRPDVLRRNRRPADGARARPGIPRAVRRLLAPGAAARAAGGRRASFYAEAEPQVMAR